MTGTIISLCDHRFSVSLSTEISLEPMIEINAVALKLWKQHDELLAIIEGLRKPELASNIHFGPIAANLQLIAAQALAEVGLLIREIERGSVIVI